MKSEAVDTQDELLDKQGKPKVMGLLLTAFLSLSVGGGSMKVWIDQYGSFRGVFLGIVTGIVVFAIGATLGFLAERVSRH